MNSKLFKDPSLVGIAACLRTRLRSSSRSSCCVLRDGSGRKCPRWRSRRIRSAARIRFENRRIGSRMDCRIGWDWKEGLKVASIARAMNWTSFWRGWAIRKSSLLSEKELLDEGCRSVERVVVCWNCVVLWGVCVRQIYDYVFSRSNMGESTTKERKLLWFSPLFYSYRFHALILLVDRDIYTKIPLCCSIAPFYSRLLTRLLFYSNPPIFALLSRFLFLLFPLRFPPFLPNSFPFLQFQIMATFWFPLFSYFLSDSWCSRGRYFAVITVTGIL